MKKRKLILPIVALLLGFTISIPSINLDNFIQVKRAQGDTTEVSFAPSDFSGQGTSGTGSAVAVTKNGVTIETDKGYGGSEFRVYSGANLTFTSDDSNYQLKGFSFTFSGGKTGGLDSSYDYNTPKANVEFNLTSQARFTKITVTLIQISEGEIKSISIKEKNDATYGFIGTNYNFEAETTGIDNEETLTWTSSNSSVATINSNGVLHPIKIGRTNITCSYETTNSSDYPFIIYPTANDLLTIEEALTVCSLSVGNNSPATYRVRGFVKDKSDVSKIIISDGTNDITLFNLVNGSNLKQYDIIEVTGYLLKDGNNLSKIANGCTYTVSSDFALSTKALESSSPVANLVFGINSQVHELEGFEKVTSAPADWSGEYILVCENENVCFDGSLETLDAVSNTIDVDINDSLIETNTDIDAATFTINEIDGGFSIQASNGEYIGQNSNANGLATSENAIVNNIEFANNGDVNIVSSNAYLRYNSASNQNRFRYYKSSSYTAQQAIQLYKKATTTKQITTHTPKNTKVNLGAILNGDNVLDIQDKVVSYGVAVAEKGKLNGNKLKDNFNQSYVGKSEVTLADTPFVYCDSQGRAPGDEDKGFVENTDNYIIFSANLAVPEANYTTELTWAAYFILDDENHSVVMTRERTESVKSLAEQYKTKEVYNDYSDEIKACINYLANA